jgi:hypothetical protein
MRKIALAALTVLVLASCSHRKPPVGRWEGTYETADIMIAARFEVESDGQVRVSAPDLLDIGSTPQEERPALRERLAGDLASGWERVAPRPMDYDGQTFRKPGGIAPQAVWNAKTKAMQLVVYLGTRPGIHIPMRRVDEFSDNPWTE